MPSLCFFTGPAWSALHNASTKRKIYSLTCVVLQCDRVPTGCAQCKRKGIKCSGYRDPSALRLRDETTRVTYKFEKTPSPKDATHQVGVLVNFNSSGSESDTETPIDSPTSPFTQLMASLQTDPSFSLRNNLHDASMSYFLTSFIYATPFQGYVPAFCLDSADPDDACSTTIAATALAAYSRSVRSAEYMECARQKYAKALTQVNELLSRPETAILDRTLASVLVLALFEAIVFEGGKSPTSWTAHTSGSMQLLRLRGPQQFKSAISRKMFAHASNNIKTSCIQRSIPVPDDFVALDLDLKFIHDPNEPAVKLSPIIHQVASIKARSIASPDCNLVHEAFKVDRELVTLARNSPAWMTYIVEPNSESPVWAYKRVCHRYPSARIAKVWNAIRLLRFFLITFIRDVVTQELYSDLSSLRLPSSSKSLAEYVSKLRQYAEDSLTDVTTDVLASVPSFVETDDFGRRFTPAGRSLAWPLGIIEVSYSPGQPEREFAYRNLEMLAGDLNMPQAIHPSRFSGTREDW